MNCVDLDSHSLGTQELALKNPVHCRGLESSLWLLGNILKNSPLEKILDILKKKNRILMLEIAFARMLWPSSVSQ